MDRRVEDKARKQEIRFWKRLAMPEVDDEDETEAIENIAPLDSRAIFVSMMNDVRPGRSAPPSPRKDTATERSTRPEEISSH